MIRRLLWLFLLLSLTLPTGAVAAKRAGNFSTLLQALTKGAGVRVVVEYGRCDHVEGGDSQFAPPLANGLLMDSWRSLIGGSPGSESLTVVLVGEELMAHPRLGMLLRQVQLDVHHDDRVAITLRHLDPETYDVVSVWRLATTIDRGDTGAAAFYLLD